MENENIFYGLTPGMILSQDLDSKKSTQVSDLPNPVLEIKVRNNCLRYLDVG